MATATKPAAPKSAPAPKATTSKLPADIFDVEVKNNELLKLAYHSYLAEARSAQAHTKTRGLIRGGGRKPWKQKGTGRARVGSNRSPIWRGGGITFGPTGHENYAINLSTKQRRTALKQALSLANKAGQISQISTFPVKDGKTKEVVSFLDAQKAARGGLLVTTSKTPELIRATQNLQGVDVVSASHVSAFNILNAHHIFIDQGALEHLTARLGKVAA